jgi:hypothetical protein
MGKLSISVARIEEQMKSLTGKIDTFILAALNPEMGYVTRNEVMIAREVVEKDTRFLTERLDAINKDHNERIASNSNRIWWIIGLNITVILSFAGLMIRFYKP